MVCVLDDFTTPTNILHQNEEFTESNVVPLKTVHHEIYSRTILYSLVMK